MNLLEASVSSSLRISVNENNTNDAPTVEWFPAVWLGWGYPAWWTTCHSRSGRRQRWFHCSLLSLPAKTAYIRQGDVFQWVITDINETNLRAELMVLFCDRS